MPDQKISQMDPAAALTGAELVPAVQSGGNVRTTTQDIANLVSLSSLGASANGITLIGHTFAQMRADLDLEAGTDFVAYSAYSANALTLIGHTFAQMRTDLSLGALALLATVGTSQIDNDAVTYAKLQNVSATSRILGRITTGAGDAEELTAANVKTILSLAQADISGLTTASTPTFAGLNITGSATLDGGAILNENDFLQLRSTSYRVLFGNDNVNVAFYKQNGSGTYISTPLNLALSDDKWTMAGALDVGGAIGLKSYTVAGLPAGSAAQIAYASNGRKNGEGAGSGTGVLVFKDGTAWRACDTGATVAA